MRASTLLSWVDPWALGFVRASVRARTGGCGSGSSLTKNKQKHTWFGKPETNNDEDDSDSDKNIATAIENDSARNDDFRNPSSTNMSTSSKKNAMDTTARKKSAVLPETL
jgi:hypothetical protein